MTLPDLHDRYTLGDPLGQGSMGLVFRGRDLRLKREVALKIMRPEIVSRKRAHARFLREADICSLLSHVNVVPIYDMGLMTTEADAKPGPCIVMPVLSGPTLRTLVRSGRFPPEVLAQWLLAACHGLAHAHDRGVVHRDFKPANVVVGPNHAVVVTDWGLAKVVRRERTLPSHHDVTRVGDVVGTPAYMAPEQAMGRMSDVGPAADTYAVGAVLYEVLTGTRPYRSAGRAEVLQALIRGIPERPSLRAPSRHMNPALEAVCRKAMARRPADRFSSMADLAAALQESLVRRAGSAHTGVGPSPLESAERTIDDNTRPPHPTPTAGSQDVLSGDAAKLLVEGQSAAAAFARLLDEAAALTSEAARRGATLHAASTDRLDGLQPAPGTLQVRPLPKTPQPSFSEGELEVWRLEAKAKDTRGEAAYHLTQGARDLRRAAEDPNEAQEAHRSLARLHRLAWAACDAAEDPVGAQYHRAQAEAWDMEGALDAELSRRADLSVETTPAGVATTVVPVDERGPIWRLGAEITLGSTPLSRRTMRASRLCLRLRTSDGLNARIPLRLLPGETRALAIVLPPSRAVPPGFVFIAGDVFQFGADDHAPGVPLEPREVEVKAFCLARHPVGWSEYFEFLEDRLAVGTDITTHLPRDQKGTTLVRVEDRGVRWRQQVYAPRGAPMRYVDHTSAKAYAKWLGRRLGVTLRLPTEAEWEYAAGGVDERPFPWGTRFVRGLADADQARSPDAKGPSNPSGFKRDESPFGVRAMAGGVREWTSSTGQEPGSFVVRGGSWQNPPARCRICARGALPGDTRDATTGIRLAADLPIDPT